MPRSSSAACSSRFADPATRTSLRYFFSAPGDTLQRGWSAVSAAYSALFRGAIFNTDSLYSNGGVPVLRPDLGDPGQRGAADPRRPRRSALAFRAGLFNIGVQGQMIIGAICRRATSGSPGSCRRGSTCSSPWSAGIIGGALWGGLAGLLKARTGAHEVITTIMLNYVAFYLLGYLLGVRGFQSATRNQAISRPIHATARLPHLLGSNLRLHAGLILAILAAVFVLVAAEPLDARLQAARGRRQPARGTHRGDERRAQLHHGHAHRGRACPAWRAVARSSGPNTYA